MLSLKHNLWNRVETRGLVRTSTNWSELGMKRISNDLSTTRSLTKWKSISTCFVCAWNIGFTDMFVAPMLSHHSFRWRRERDTEFMRKSLNPKEFSNSVGNRFIFCFRIGVSDGGLLPRAPWNQVRAKEDTIGSCGESNIWAACPICIWVGLEASGLHSMKEQPVRHSVL
jgi:hypothetical protein